MSSTATTNTLPEWDRDLIAKYDIAGPRYTSYPTALHFSDDFSTEDYAAQASRQAQRSIAPLSLYLHIPFCQNICYYCACNKIVTKDRSASRRYLDHLAKEIAMQGALFGKHRKVTQLHLGGGTPTFLDNAELTELMHHLAHHFQLIDSDEREYSIEIDPRTISKDTLALLKGLGFNRISLGVQDFDPQVQHAINRIQSIEMVQELTEAARLYQFKSVSYDLIYGLPYQTPQSLTATLNEVIALNPDRIAFYNYAHLPDRFNSQRAIDRLHLPSAKQKLDMLSVIASTLTQAGYHYIGMDHFVKPNDDLAIAQQQGKLQRNFQGYSTCMAPDLVGMGVSSISSLEHCYAQNEKELEAYYAAIERGELAICKGLLLSEDDELRRQVIRQIICNLELDTKKIERLFGIRFNEYFSTAVAALAPMENDGLIKWHGDTLRVTERGRSMLRNICMPFDKHLENQPVSAYSKAI
jgi:oxygen-independent coproporphyrinogen-3 oxidase